MTRKEFNNRITELVIVGTEFFKNVMEERSKKPEIDEIEPFLMLLLDVDGKPTFAAVPDIADGLRQYNNEALDITINMLSKKGDVHGLFFMTETWVVEAKSKEERDAFEKQGLRPSQSDKKIDCLMLSFQTPFSERVISYKFNDDRTDLTKHHDSDWIGYDENNIGGAKTGLLRKFSFQFEDDDNNVNLD